MSPRKCWSSEGDQVDKSTIGLIQLDSEQAQTELEAAEAAYEAARLESDNDIDARYAQRTLEVRERELDKSIDANRQFSGSISPSGDRRVEIGRGPIAAGDRTGRA